MGAHGFTVYKVLSKLSFRISLCEKGKPVRPPGLMASISQMQRPEWRQDRFPAFLQPGQGLFLGASIKP